MAKKIVEEVKESKTVKESIELLNGLGIIIDGAGEVLEDGKVDWKDINPAIGVVKRFEELAEAVKGANEIPAELKDIDETEMLQLGQAAFVLISKLRKAF